MNNKALTLSIGMALLGFFFVSSYVTSIEDEAKKKFGTEILVVKAKQFIREQDTLTANMLEYVLIPKRFLEPAAVYFEKKEEDKETAKGLKDLEGSVAVVPIKKGEQLTYNKLTTPSVRTGLAPQIAPGRRAISIPVNEVSGVSKLVKPGDRIDLIAVMDLGGGKENKISKTILQDVVVLAVGRNVTNNVARLIEIDPYSGKEKIKSLSEDASFGAVTLEVEPGQAQVMALVMANAENAVTISLRNNDDTDRVTIGATTAADILGADAARVQRAPAKK